MSLAEVQQRERQARWETRARLRAGVYADSDQTHVLTFRQRDCVVQYIGVVCEDYELSTQTAWTAMNYFDRYLSARGSVPIERNEAELISLTCVLLAAKFIENRSPAISDLVSVAANSYPKADFTAAELLVLELLAWQLHTVTPHTYVVRLLMRVNLGNQAQPHVQKHTDFFVDLSSFELLGFDFSGETIAGAAVFCALWNMREEDYEHPSSRLDHIVSLLGCGVNKVDVHSCVRRLVKAFIALEADHARVAAETKVRDLREAALSAAAATAASAAATGCAGEHGTAEHGTDSAGSAECAGRQRGASKGGGGRAAEDAPDSPNACVEVNDSFAPLDGGVAEGDGPRGPSPDSITATVGAMAGQSAAATSSVSSGALPGGALGGAVGAMDAAAVQAAATAAVAEAAVAAAEAAAHAPACINPEKGRVPTRGEAARVAAEIAATQAVEATEAAAYAAAEAQVQAQAASTNTSINNSSV